VDPLAAMLAATVCLTTVVWRNCHAPTRQRVEQHLASARIPAGNNALQCTQVLDISGVSAQLRGSES
jgi:hypothetical protein